MYSSITPVCFTSPLIEKPIGKVRMNPFLVERYDLSLLAVISFCLELFGWNNWIDLKKVAGKIPILNCLVGAGGFRPRQKVELRDVDPRVSCFSYCFHFHPNDVVPNPHNILVSQLFDSSSSIAYQNLLEEGLLVFYTVGEENNLFPLSQVQYLGQCKLNWKTKWQINRRKGLLQWVGGLNRKEVKTQRSCYIWGLLKTDKLWRSDRRKENGLGLLRALNCEKVGGGR